MPKGEMHQQRLSSAN